MAGTSAKAWATDGSATKLVLGCGYLGQRVAAAWRQAGARVWVGTRRPERAAGFAREGYEPLVLDVTAPETLRQLPKVDTLLYAIAYDPQGGGSREVVTVEGLRHVLDALPESTGRLLFVSTTGVYGQQAGEWVDEQSPCHPQRAGGRCYLAAERLLQAHPWGSRAVILRLAGIYGPGRIPYLDRLQAGLPLQVDPAGYLNLIHVDDAVRAILACEQVPVPDLFVVADGVPVPRADYYREVARQIGCTPSFAAPDPGSPQAERAGTSKRICNRKLIAQLGLQFAYPSYREGIAAILGDRSLG